jgi:hypothetical protein
MMDGFIDALLLETMFNQWLDAVAPEDHGIYHRAWARRMFVQRLVNLTSRPHNVVSEPKERTV